MDHKETVLLMMERGFGEGNKQLMMECLAMDVKDHDPRVSVKGEGAS
jgi:hypothetical protein